MIYLYKIRNFLSLPPCVLHERKPVTPPPPANHQTHTLNAKISTTRIILYISWCKYHYIWLYARALTRMFYKLWFKCTLNISKIRLKLQQNSMPGGNTWSFLLKMSTILFSSPLAPYRDGNPRLLLLPPYLLVGILGQGKGIACSPDHHLWHV